MDQKYFRMNSIRAMRQILYLLLFSTCMVIQASAIKPEQPVYFKVGLEGVDTHQYRIEMEYEAKAEGDIVFCMSSWTPGYYQMLDFAKQVQNLQVEDASGKSLPVVVNDENSWRIKVEEAGKMTLSYTVQCLRSFVATPWIDKDRAYLLTGGLFLYPQGELDLPVEIEMEKANGWENVATGLSYIDESGFHLRAANYDVLFDSPILVGQLESLPSFEVKGVPHYFIGYQLGEFDKQAFMDDLKKIVEAAVDLIGDIPYDQYTFIGIGPGQGGIEHLNSTAVSFDGSSLNDSISRLQMMSFLAHEYFHHYNVKRIRPIELGPFDYGQETHTNMLWVAEGLTVYYEYLIMKRAGLFSEDELLDALHSEMLELEHKPGRLFQTLAESSYNTWSDGPFGRVDDEVNKTISYYHKGPLVGWLFDFEIRRATENKKSLDDVMRRLYYQYYKEKARGFTEAELRRVIEDVAGEKLDELYDYIYTTKELDYNKYLNAGGYVVDTVCVGLPGAWSGIQVHEVQDTVYTEKIEWKSPAWNAGLRSRQRVVDSTPIAPKDLKPLLKEVSAGDTLIVQTEVDGAMKKVPVVLGTKQQRSFNISKEATITPTQQAIRESWLGETK